MAEYTSGNTYIKKETNTTADNRELAGDYLAEKGYEHHVKPREVNGGRDRLSKDHTRVNRERLNSSLVSTPAQVKSTVQRKKTVKSGAMDSMLVEIQTEKSKTPLPISAIVCLAVMTVMLLYVVHLCIEFENITSAIAECKSQITEMKLEERILQSEKASKYDLEEIERIAKEKYGMVDADQLPKEYITPDAEDSIEIMETLPEEETPGALLSGFANVVSDLLSYIN